MKAVFRNPWVRFIGLLVLIFLGLRIVYIIRGVLIPFSLALVAAYIFDPVVDWLELKRIGKWRLRRGGAIALLVALFLLVLAAFVFIAIPHTISTAASLLTQENVDRIIEFAPQGVRDLVNEVRTAPPDERRKIIQRVLGDAVGALFADRGAASAASESARAVALGTFSVVMWVFRLILFFVVTVFLLSDIDRLRVRVRDALPLGYKDEILRVSHEIDVNLKAFFRGQVVVVAVLTCIFTIGLGLVGCPFWYIVGIAGGIGAFVPYFALASGMVPAVILSAANYGNVWRPLAAVAVFAFGIAVDNILVTPKVIGKSVGMHPVAIILSILVFGTLFGFLGVIFAVPIAAVVKVLAQELFAKYKASGLYSGQAKAESTSGFRKE